MHRRAFFASLFAAVGFASRSAPPPELTTIFVRPPGRMPIAFDALPRPSLTKFVVAGPGFRRVLVEATSAGEAERLVRRHFRDRAPSCLTIRELDDVIAEVSSSNASRSAS